MNATRRRAATRVSRLSRVAAVPFRRQPGAPVLERRSQAPLSAHSATPDGSREPHANTVSESGVPSLPADVAADLVAGRLSQRCPDCGITEAAGGYCTKCDRRTGPADWLRQCLSAEQKAARRTRGHSTAETGATALEAANPEPLGLWPA